MSRSNPSHRPVLITPEDIRGLERDEDYRFDEFYVTGGIKQIIEAKRDAHQDGVTEAVGLLLTKASVAIGHVDTTKRHRPYRDRRYVYNTDGKVSIGFNDHGGGSESHFKILLNGAPDGTRDSYVLYSPPGATGAPTNTNFHRADFTFLSWEPKGPYSTLGYVPNILKTGRDYRHFLFGGPDTPQQVYERFEQAGFGFVQEPYTDDYDPAEAVVTRYSLRNQEDQARAALGYNGFKAWPADQFAEQVAALGLEVPKISPDVYPLVRPENSTHA